jgi:TRAP-type uncharacterized transport system fused permease subunit
MDNVKGPPAFWLRVALFVLAFVFILAQLILLIRHRHVPVMGYAGTIALAFLSAAAFRAAYDDGVRGRMNGSGIVMAAIACVVLLGAAAVFEALSF